MFWQYLLLNNIKKKLGRKVSLEIMVQFYKKLLYYFASTRSVCL